MEQNNDRGSEFDMLFDTDNIVDKRKREQKENRFWWL
jgi:hypothetical protein